MIQFVTEKKRETSKHSSPANLAIPNFPRSLRKQAQCCVCTGTACCVCWWTDTDQTDGRKRDGRGSFAGTVTKRVRSSFVGRYPVRRWRFRLGARALKSRGLSVLSQQDFFISQKVIFFVE